MSSELSPLLSATFYEPGYQHLVELVHQRDEMAHRHLESLEVAVYDAAGARALTLAVDPAQEVLDLDALLAGRAGDRAMVTFDARYDARIFPYRPHHYAYLHRRGSAVPPLYYAVSAVLGGVPDRIGATGINNFETYVFLRRPLPERHAVVLGNVSRYAAAEARVIAYYAETRREQTVTIEPKAHVEVALDGEHEGRRLERVEVKGLFRLASYVVGRSAATGDLVLFDHMFSYFK
jgi:hypothetical protein